MPFALVTVVVPVFRSQETLPELHRRISDTLTKEQQAFELILVEDCGGDASWNTIVSLCRQDDRVRGYRLSRNYGQHNAVLCGIREARGDVIVTLDDDLQNPPEEIPKLLSGLSNNVDVVYGYPESGLKHGFLRNLASRITKYVLRSAMAAETADRASAFRAFRTRLRDAFSGYHGPTVMLDVMLTWGTTRFATVFVRHEERKQGVSGYSFGKLLTHALNMITGFSPLPLQVASVGGFLFSLVGFALMIRVFVLYLTTGGSVPGFTFLAAAITMFSGVQLFAIGVIGEYIARIHFRSMGRPTFTVAESSESCIAANSRNTSASEPFHE